MISSHIERRTVVTEYTLQKHPDVADTKITLKWRNRSKRVKTKIKLIDSCIDLQKKERKQICYIDTEKRI